jgi:hypothetical protein
MGRDMHCTDKSMLTIPCPKEISQRSASMVKWTTLDPSEGLTMQGSKVFIKFSFFEILFYKMLRTMLIYKVQ